MAQPQNFIEIRRCQTCGEYHTEARVQNRVILRATDVNDDQFSYTVFVCDACFRQFSGETFSDLSKATLLTEAV